MQHAPQVVSQLLVLTFLHLVAHRPVWGGGFVLDLQDVPHAVLQVVTEFSALVCNYDLGDAVDGHPLLPNGPRHGVGLLVGNCGEAEDFGEGVGQPEDILGVSFLVLDGTEQVCMYSLIRGPGLRVLVMWVGRWFIFVGGGLAGGALAEVVSDV